MTTSKKRLFELYDRIYSSNNEIGNLDICQQCEATCEEGIDIVVLLPLEDEFIQYKLKKEHHTQCTLPAVRAIESADGKCPFFANKKCTIHSFRPIDCRTYPLTPLFTEKSFHLKLLRGCPHSDKIPRNFLNQIFNMWIYLLPFLSSDWKKKYNHIVSSLPLRDLPLHLN